MIFKRFLSKFCKFFYILIVFAYIIFIYYLFVIDPTLFVCGLGNQCQIRKTYVCKIEESPVRNPQSSK